MKVIQYISMLSILLIACDAPNTSNTQSTTSPVQQAWDEMMVIHDEVMPKMSEINRLKKQLSAQGDTTTVFKELQAAENGMWDWMHNLTPLDQIKKMEEGEAMQQLKTETATIAKVSEMMNQSIEEGKQLLPKNETE